MILSSNAHPDDGAQLAGLLVRPILALGRPAFADALLEVAGAVVGADLVSAFSIDGDCRPHYRLSSAVAELGGSFAQRAGARYATDYWQSDPGLDQLVQAHRAGSGTVVCQQAWNQIPHAWYRTVCYEQPQLVDRVSVLGAVGGRLFLFSAYRRAVHGCFGPGEIRRFTSSADVLMALVSRHVDLAAAQPQAYACASSALEEQLAERFPALSLRERQVCAGIVRGLAAKDIARTCDIEPSSVITYKKRALAKLGLPNQRALVAQWHEA